jgi:hypothetical protein
MRVPDGGVSALARAGALALMALFSPGEARADDNPEAGLTQREFNKVTEMRQEDPNLPPVAVPVHVHNLTDAEKAELDRMHAVRVIKGKDWKNLSPEERDARVRGLRAQMPNASLCLTVPGGDLWAIPPGEDNINFLDIIDRDAIRRWTEAEKAALPVAVSNANGNNPRSGRQEERVVQAAEKEQP